MLYNCYIFICDWIHIFFRKHGFRDHRQRRGREKVDYGEGIATTGFYVALNEDNGAVMAGFSPEAVLRTLSGLRIRNPGKRSATGEACRHHPRMTQTQKSSAFRLSFLLYLMPGSSLLSHGETPHYPRRYGVSLLSSAWGQVGPPR